MDFSVYDEKGNRVACDVIGMFSRENKNFIIYTDNEYVEEEKEVLASLYKIENNQMILMPIIDETDWDLVDRYLEEI